MLFYLNLVFAWISMIAAGFLAVVYLLRVLNKKKKMNFISQLNRTLRQNHKSIGVVLIIFGLAHGILSSDKAIGFNLGTFSWIVSILLGLSFVYRKRFIPQRIWMSLHRFLTIAFIAIMVIHVVDVGGFAIDDVLFSDKSSAQISNVQTSAVSNIPPTNTPSAEILFAPSPFPAAQATDQLPIQPTQTPTEEPTPMPINESKYQDGIYQATAEGFRPGLTVEVEILNDKIVRVEVIKHNEVNERYWGRPVEYLPQCIIEAQSTDVEAISGATYTSRGIIAAVDKALTQALR